MATKGVLLQDYVRHLQLCDPQKPRFSPGANNTLSRLGRLKCPQVSLNYIFK